MPEPYSLSVSTFERLIGVLRSVHKIDMNIPPIDGAPWVRCQNRHEHPGRGKLDEQTRRSMAHRRCRNRCEHRGRQNESPSRITKTTIGLREVTIDARELLNVLAFLDSDTIEKGLMDGEIDESDIDLVLRSVSFRYPSR
jgi:hypothetical protein